MSNNIVLPVGWIHFDPKSLAPETSRFEYDGGSPWTMPTYLDPEYLINENRKKCQCGVCSVMKPEDDHYSFHSSYCPVNEHKLDVKINSKK